jgi:hypothetical protein
MIRLPNDTVPDARRRSFVTAVVSLTAISSGALTVLGILDPAGALPGAGTHAARTLTGYITVRNVVLLGVLVATLWRRAWAPVRLALLLNALTQAGDGVVGISAGRPLLPTVSPFVFAAALTAAVIALVPDPSCAQPAAPTQRRRRSREALLLGAPRWHGRVEDDREASRPQEHGR